MGQRCAGAAGKARALLGRIARPLGPVLGPVPEQALPVCGPRLSELPRRAKREAALFESYAVVANATCDTSGPMAIPRNPSRHSFAGPRPAYFQASIRAWGRGFGSGIRHRAWVLVRVVVSRHEARTGPRRRGAESLRSARGPRLEARGPAQRPGALRQTVADPAVGGPGPHPHPCLRLWPTRSSGPSGRPGPSGRAVPTQSAPPRPVTESRRAAHLQVREIEIGNNG